MKKRFLSVVLAICLMIPALVLSGCGHEHDWEFRYGYDENGSYCKYEVCEECEEEKNKTVIVQGVSQTNAVVGGTNISELKYKNGTYDNAFTLGMSFNDMVNQLNTRSASGHNTSFVQTVYNGVTKQGLPIKGNIKLTQDINISYNGNTTLCLLITEDVTIDLNGHTITQQCGTDGFSGYGLFVVYDGATLNIIDSSQNHNGAINAVVTALQINVGGVVNLYDGTVKCGATMTPTDVSEQYFCVWTIATNGGTFNQYGGKVETVATRNVRNGEPYTATDYNYTFASYGAGEFNLYGGTVTGVADESTEIQINDYRD